MTRITLCTCIYLFVTSFRTGDGLFLDENTIISRFESLEARVEQLKKELEVVQGCSADFCEIHWTKWSGWSSWSQCTGQCDQGYGSSEQTRTRVRSCMPHDQGGLNCAGNSTETERRPCNAVELYGCLNPAHNTSQGYGMVYNFFDELAQSTCTAAVHSVSHVLALRRNCASGKAPPCSRICANAGYKCFDELHVYKPQNLLNPDFYNTDEGKPGLMMYRYFSCTFVDGTCGPNYCCCRD